MTALRAEDRRSVLLTGPGLATIFLIYALTHTVGRVTLSGSLTTDDAQAALLVSEWAFGYDASQPPLYDWLLLAAHQLFGVSLFSAAFVKYVLLGIAVFFLFALARMVLNDVRLSVLAVLSFSLFYQVGWNLLEGVTHSLPLIASAAASLYFIVIALRTQQVVAYLALGVAFGCGLLSKFSFALFLPVLLLSIFSIGVLRRRLRPGLLLVALVIASAMTTPYLAWLIMGSGPVLLSGEVQVGLAVALGLDGPVHLLSIMLLYSLLFLPLFPLVFWGNLRTPSDVTDKDALAVAFVTLMWRFFGVSIAALIVLTTMSGVSDIKERHLHPFFLTFPIACFTLLKTKPLNHLKVRRYGFLLLAVAGVFGLIRFVTLLYPHETVCGRCREMIPYEALATAVAEHDNRSAIFATDPYTAGNLRRFFPDRDVAILGSAYRSYKQAACLVIWRDHSVRDDALPIRMIEKLPFGLGLRKKRRVPEPDLRVLPYLDHSALVTADWNDPFSDQPLRQTFWRIAIEDDQAQCAGLARFHS